MSKRTCLIDGCDRPTIARGYCAAHYQRWRKGQDMTTPLSAHFDSPAEAFASRTEWRGDCLEWTGPLYRNGYGQMSVKGVKMMPHRYAYEAEVGSIPDGMQVDHICRNRACCNIDHLRLATSSQNMQNQTRRDRSNASKFRGVYKNSHSGKWFVQAKIDGQLHYGGMFDSIEDADSAAAELRNRLFTYNNDDRAA